jgi:ABC-type Fe3+ transport system permease subunit
MYRRALLRGLYSSCVALSILWLTCDAFDTEPVAALTIGVLVSMFDWIDIALMERRAKRAARGKSRARDARDEAGSLHVPAFMLSVAMLCAILFSASTVAHAFYRPDSIETTSEGAGMTHTVKSYRAPWASGMAFELEHAKRAINAADAAGESKR